uniref:Uncharacterized protein n=1 Tax=Rhizophora mucronata TaxID=61149 RepID=A0A2P2NH65_RHIMU
MNRIDIYLSCALSPLAAVLISSSCWFNNLKNNACLLIFCAFLISAFLIQLASLITCKLSLLSGIESIFLEFDGMHSEHFVMIYANRLLIS